MDTEGHGLHTIHTQSVDAQDASEIHVSIVPLDLPGAISILAYISVSSHATLRSQKSIKKKKKKKKGGNIQGDGRKSLGQFKHHFGPQVSSESLKQGHI